MKNKIKAGTASFIDRVFIVNSTTGQPLTGLAHNTAGLVMHYARIGDTTATAVTLANCTLGTYTSGGFKEFDATNMPGLYEVHYPAAMIASGSRKVHAVLRGAANMQPTPIEIELDAVDYLDSIAFGLSAIPSAPHSGSGGLITVGTSGGQISPSLGSVNVANGSQTAIAGKVWDEARSSHVTAGTFGAYVLARDDSGATLATSSALSTAAGNITTILGQTGTTGVVVASGSKSGYSLTQAFPTNFASLAITGGGAVTAGTVSDKTGYSLTQSFPTNFASLAISGGGAVTAGTVSDKTGYSLATTPPTAAQIATQVWSETIPGSYTSGQAGNTVGNLATGSAPSAATIAAAVWNEPKASHTTTGTYGYLLDTQISTISGGGGPSAATIAAAVWNEPKSSHTTADTYGYLLDVQSSTLSTASSLTTVGNNVSTILGQTGTTGVVVAAGSKSGYSLTQSFPANFASLAITAGGAVTAGTVSDKSGYSLTQSFPTNFASLAISGGGAVTVGTNSDKTGYSLTVTPPTLSQITDGILNTALTESYAADGAQGTLTQIAYALQQNAFDASISGTTKTVKKLNGSTTALTLTLDNATTPTSISRTG